jgi:NAD(P)-dependent dehydrogenase (short-subunit alcohol dehydrogenase family)
MFTSLQGRSAIVTGGSKGIGRGIATTFAAGGVNVLVTARNQTDLDATVADLADQPGRVSGLQADVTNPQDCRIITEGLIEMGQEYIDQMAAAIPAGRLGSVADIGHAALFFATDEAAYITGQTLVVDGGQILPESNQALAEV